jgi:hypothetical protein
MELSIEKNSKVTFKIKWKPGKPDSYKYAILFEVVNSAKLKFLVHCYGHCVFKQFTSLQSSKKGEPPGFGENAKKEATLKPAVTKSNLTTTAGPTSRTFLVHSIYNKPAKPAQRHDIYSNSFDDCEEVDEARRLAETLAFPESPTVYDIRSQACISGLTHISGEGKFFSVQSGGTHFLNLRVPGERRFIHELIKNNVA